MAAASSSASATSSVQTRSSTATTPTRNSGGGSSVREKARRRWEQRAAQKWKEQVKAEAEQQRQHEEKAEEEEHERLLVEKAAKAKQAKKEAMRRQQQKAEKARRQRQQQQQQQQQQDKSATTTSATNSGGSKAPLGKINNSSSSKVKARSQNRRRDTSNTASLPRPRPPPSRTKVSDPPAAAAAAAAAGRPPLAASTTPSPHDHHHHHRSPSKSTSIGAGNRSTTSSSTNDTVTTDSMSPPPPPPRRRPAQARSAQKTRPVGIKSESRVVDKKKTSEASKAGTNAKGDKATGRSTSGGTSSKKMLRQSALSAVSRRGGGGGIAGAGAAPPSSSAVGAYSPTGMRDILTGRLKQKIIDQSQNGNGSISAPGSSRGRASSSLSDVGVRTAAVGGRLSADDLKALMLGGHARLKMEKEKGRQLPGAANTTNVRAVDDTSDTATPVTTNNNARNSKSKRQHEPEEEIEDQEAIRSLNRRRQQQQQSTPNRHRCRFRSHDNDHADPPDSNDAARHKGDPPGSKADASSKADTSMHREERNGVAVVPNAPDDTKQQQQQQQQQVDLVEQTDDDDDDDDDASCEQLQNMHRITEIHGRGEGMNTHDTVCSRSVVSELTCDDHSAATDHDVSHCSMSASEAEEEAAEATTIADIKLSNGQRMQHTLPSVHEEEAVEATAVAGAALSDGQRVQQLEVSCVHKESLESTQEMPLESSPDKAIRPKESSNSTHFDVKSDTKSVATKKNDTSLNQILRDAHELLEVTDTKLEESVSEQDDDSNENFDPAVKREMEDLRASLKYVELQLYAAQSDITRQKEIEDSLLLEVQELMQTIALSDPSASREIEREADDALRREEEARMALAHEEREHRWIEQDLEKKIETEKTLRSTLKALNAQLVNVEGKNNLEEINLLERAEACKEEEKMLQEEYNKLLAHLEEVADSPVDCSGLKARVDIGIGEIEAELFNVSADDTDGTGSQPFDQRNELSMIIDDYVGAIEPEVEEAGSCAPTTPLGKEAKAAIREMEAMILVFEKTIEHLELKQEQVMSPIIPRKAPQQPPDVPRVVSPSVESTSQDNGEGEFLPKILSMSSPMKGEESPGEAPHSTSSLKEEEGAGETSLDLSISAPKVEESSGEAPLDKSREFNKTKDTSFSTTKDISLTKDLSLEAITDMKEYFTPGTPKRLANKVWGKSPKRALNLSSSVISMNEQDTVSSIGSKEPLLRRSPPETPQRYSKMAQKCHDMCEVLDTLYTMPFWSDNKGIPEDKEVSYAKYSTVED